MHCDSSFSKCVPLLYCNHPKLSSTRPVGHENPLLGHGCIITDNNINRTILTITIVKYVNSIRQARYNNTSNNMQYVHLIQDITVTLYTSWNSTMDMVLWYQHHNVQVS